ncbi:MAG: peptidylprolyl isomerase [Thermoanaerobaculia bacterium]
MTLRRLVREPLVHFLILGMGLLVLYGVFGREKEVRDDRIVVSTAQIERLAALWARQWRRPPTEQELTGLIESHIREEVLFREALAIGLDRDDTVIRRRLAQKIDFLAQDLALQGTPPEADLRAFFEANSDKFGVPGRISFSHVYVNRDRRGAAAESDAKQILASLRAGADPRQQGDRFMLQDHYALRSPDEVARELGTAFATAIFELPVGDWHGPIESGYGLHLVRVEEREEPYLPEFAVVRDKVETEYTSVKRRETNEAFYAKLREGYEIVVEQPVPEQEASAASPTPGQS